MVQPIGVSNRAVLSPSGSGAAGLQGQLARTEKELADCVNCASSETSEGKQKIQEISLRITQIRERIEQASQLSSSLQAERLAGISSLRNVDSAQAGSEPSAGLGRLIDVRA